VYTAGRVCVCAALLHYLIPFLLFLVLLRRYSLENDISNVLNKKAAEGVWFQRRHRGNTGWKEEKLY